MFSQVHVLYVKRNLSSAAIDLVIFNLYNVGGMTGENSEGRKD